jgi:hypothetical protein
MKRPFLLGIHGKARSGKDTLCQFILSSSGGYRYSLADPIKAMLRAGFGIDMADPYWETHKETVIPALGKSPRQLLQTLGTEWGRHCIREDVWLLLAQDALKREGAGMVVPDVRFENEAVWVRDLGGRILHIIRKEATPVNAHASESGVEILPQDLVLTNDGTLEDLYDAAKQLFE